jgi:hypothetical protein
MPAGSQDGTNWYFLAGKGASTRIIHSRHLRGEIVPLRTAATAQEDPPENTRKMEFSL